MTWRILLLAFVPLLPLAAKPDAQQRTRIEALKRSLLAPCCYSEPVSTHQSEIAVQMRAEIALWVEQGKSEREILDTYKQRYGARVLIEPEGSTWWWMNVVPWIAALIGLVFTIWVVRRMRTPVTAR